MHIRNFIIYNLGRFIPDKIWLQLKYIKAFGRFCNFKNPKTFNEKLQWLKLYDRNPEYSKLVDKYEVKKYVAARIGEEHVIPLLGGPWESFDEIDFDLLPNQFVLKTNHDCGGIVICRDKNTFDVNKARKFLTTHLQNNYYLVYREWPYKNVKPRIIAEQYMEDESKIGLNDYKFFCFYGKVKALFIATDRNNPNEETKFDFFDDEFNHLPFTNGHPNSTVAIQKPLLFDEMKCIAEKLSKGFPHLRVDLYCVNGRIFFGEFTFYHWSGFMPFEPEEWDRKLGDWIVLPEKEK